MRFSVVVFPATLLCVCVLVCGTVKVNAGPGIPQFDMREWFEGTTETKQSFAQKWNEAFHMYGFCSIVNHGIPNQIIDSLYQVTRQFFDLPMNEKMKYSATEGNYSPGFHPVGKEFYSSDSKKPNQNHHWQFHVSTEDDDDDEEEALLPPLHRCYPPLYSAAKPYIDAVRNLQRTLFEISDEALDLPSGTFEQFHFNGGNPFLHCRLTDYFELPETNSDRVGAHTDFLSYTILKVDDIPGLEVAVGESHFETSDFSLNFDHWVPIEVRSDALIINAGDMIRYWTNGYWKSAFHRVVSDPRRRISIAIFSGPGMAARTDARLPCSVCGETRRFAEIAMTVTEYLSWRGRLGTLKEGSEAEKEGLSGTKI